MTTTPPATTTGAGDYKLLASLVNKFEQLLTKVYMGAGD